MSRCKTPWTRSRPSQLCCLDYIDTPFLRFRPRYTNLFYVSACVRSGEGVRDSWLCIGIPRQKESLGNWRIAVGALMHMVYTCPSSRADGQWRLLGSGENMAPGALHHGFLVVDVIPLYSVSRVVGCQRVGMILVMTHKHSKIITLGTLYSRYEYDRSYHSRATL